MQSFEAVCDSVLLKDRPWFPYLCTEVGGWRWRATMGDYYNLWVVFNGSGILSCGDQMVDFEPGMFFLLAPGQRVSAMQLQNVRITRFAMHFIPMYRGHPADPAVLGMVLAARMQNPAKIQKRVDKIVRLTMGVEIDEGELGGLCYELLLRLFATSDEELDARLIHPEIMAALQRIEEHPGSVESIDELARQASLSRSHFDRLFRQCAGMPPNQFLMNARIAEAKRLLESTGMQISEIADILGYRDVYFFSRQFKQQTNLSPSQYRTQVFAAVG